MAPLTRFRWSLTKPIVTLGYRVTRAQVPIQFPALAFRFMLRGVLGVRQKSKLPKTTVYLGREGSTTVSRSLPRFIMLKIGGRPGPPSKLRLAANRLQTGIVIRRLVSLRLIVL